jgi:hypothetical protein
MAGPDKHEAIGWLGYFADGKVLEAYLKYMTARAEAFVALWWWLIEAVAEALLARTILTRAAWRPLVERQASRMPRTPTSIPSKSAALCSKSVLTWTHGADPERRSATICSISASVSPRRRACATNASRPRTSTG